MNLLQTTQEQLVSVGNYFDSLAERSDRLPSATFDISEKVYE